MNTSVASLFSSATFDSAHCETLVQNITDYAISMLDPQGILLSWNAGAQKIHGFKPEEILGSHFSRLHPPEANARKLPEQALKIAASEGRFEDESWRIRKDCTLFWANVVITRIVNAVGQLLGYALVTRDFTERHSRELALKHSEERFRLLISGVKDYAIFMLDPKGVVTTWNSGAEYIKGYAAEEIIGRHFSTFYPPEAIERRLPETELQGATMQGRFEDEGWRIRKDGSRFWANVIITAVRNAQGQLVGFSKITRNLTERRRHEEELRHSEERFRLLVDGVTEYAIMTLNSDGFVTSWNAGAERIKGYKTHEILGKHVSHFYPAEAILDNQPWKELNVARTQGRVTSEGWRVRKDGTLFWASTVITALRDDEGRARGFAKVTQDLTQRRHAEALADTTQRMHEFIAMLAHELRNPLAPIRNAVALMGRKGLQDPTLEAMRQTIDRQSLQMTRLLDELLDVNRIARGQFSVERELIDIHEAIARAVEACRPLIDQRKHHLKINVLDKRVFVHGDLVRLTQALVNLLNNAAKYTPDGGQISLTLFERGTEIEIVVADNGKGITYDMLESIFDLFVQVDPLANAMLGGLGVGLALVRRVAELHGGSVQARSEGSGHGAEFTLRLPRSIDKPQLVPNGSPAIDAPLQTRRALVVDDNRDAADMLAQLLQSMGQEIRTVYDGASALSVANTFNPHLVFLDIGMPHMSGYEVAKAFQTLSLSVKPTLIAVTGWGQEADKERATAAGFKHHFIKPVTEESLRTLIKETD